MAMKRRKRGIFGSRGSRNSRRTRKSEVLGKVIEFGKYHVEKPMNDIEKPLKSAKMSEVVDAWDAKFVDIEQELSELILAANYMDIKSCSTLRAPR